MEVEMNKTITNFTQTDKETVLRILDTAIEDMEERKAELEALQSRMDDEANDFVDMMAERKHEAL